VTVVATAPLYGTTVSNVVFPLAALGLMVVGTLLLVLRNREPKGLDHGIRSFQREMKALAPEARRRGEHRASSLEVAASPPAPRPSTSTASPVRIEPITQARPGLRVVAVTPVEAPVISAAAVDAIEPTDTAAVDEADAAGVDGAVSGAVADGATTDASAEGDVAVDPGVAPVEQV
jgi:hypothetical protein